MVTFRNRRLSSFAFLNTTQFLAALNDNIFKLLIIYFFIQVEGIENSHTILAMTGAIFVLPFLFFSAFAGTLADRISKRTIIIITKSLEFLTLGLGLLAFHYESKLGAYFVLFMMATYSAIFAPSKYSILPEIVPKDHIPKANGLMTSFTFLAIILGTFAASFLLEITHYNFTFAMLCTMGLAFIAVVASFCIDRTPPSGSSKRFNVFFLGEIFSTLKLATHYPSLLTSIVGSAFFLFLGAYVQLNVIPFAMQSLDLSDVQGGYLFLLTALGIGTGSILAGKISGRIVELGLVPLAAIGVAICCFLLDAFSHSLYVVIPLVILLGLFGGLYQVPLDSNIQVSSPRTSRGQVVAASNFLSFFGVLCASALLYLNSVILGLSADKGFVIIGFLTVLVAAVLSYQYFDYVTRYIAMLLSRLHFSTTLKGQECISDAPSIYICRHTAWNDTLLMLGAQRRRMRFFIEQEHDHKHRWVQRIYHMLRVVFIPEMEALQTQKHPNGKNGIKELLSKEFSICIFVENDDLAAEIDKLNQSYHILKIRDEIGCPIIPVSIEKGEKIEAETFFSRLLKKFRVPAAISFG